MTCLRSGISSVRADFSPPGEADLPHHFSHGSSNRTRESSESGKDSYLPDGECSVKCQWGTRIRLKAFAVLTKSATVATDGGRRPCRERPGAGIRPGVVCRRSFQPTGTAPTSIRSTIPRLLRGLRHYWGVAATR